MQSYKINQSVSDPLLSAYYVPSIVLSSRNRYTQKQDCFSPHREKENPEKEAEKLGKVSGNVLHMRMIGNLGQSQSTIVTGEMSLFQLSSLLP